MDIGQTLKAMKFHELPDDLREPLHSLQADLDWIFGRIAADGSMAGPLRDSARNRLSQIETAAYRLTNAPGLEREECAKIADLYERELVDRRDEKLSEGSPNVKAAHLFARQAQTAAEIAKTIRGRIA